MNIEDEESESIESTTFVRKTFYVKPPNKGAPVEEWRNWMDKDRQEAINAKRAHTKALAQEDLPDSLVPSRMVKINGVWKQSCAVGLVGDGPDAFHSEPMVEADQEKVTIMSQWTDSKRGTKSYKKTRSEQRQARRIARSGKSINLKVVK